MSKALLDAKLCRHVVGRAGGSWLSIHGADLQGWVGSQDCKWGRKMVPALLCELRYGYWWVVRN